MSHVLSSLLFCCTAYRQWSNRVSLAYKAVPFIGFLWLLLCGHRFLFYSAASGTCVPQPGVYEKYDTFFEVVVAGVCPPTIIMVLGILLLRSVRQVLRRRVVPSGVTTQTGNSHPSHIQQIDAQLTRMILLQSFVAIPSFIPYGAQNVYSSITQNWYKSPLRIAWENVVIESIRLLSYIFYSSSFYVSFLSSRGFRKAFYQSIGRKRTEKSAQNTHMAVNCTTVTRHMEQRQAQLHNMASTD